MANLTIREHVANDLLDLKQDFERVFNHFFKPHAHAFGTAETFFAVAPPIETWVDTEDKEFHLTIPVPGIKPEALSITLQGNQLTFTGEQKEETDQTRKSYLAREIVYGRFSRTVTLPDGVEGDKISAEVRDGVLEITAPIAAAALPKKITVKNGTPIGDSK